MLGEHHGYRRAVIEHAVGLDGGDPSADGMRGTAVRDELRLCAERGRKQYRGERRVVSKRKAGGDAVFCERPAQAAVIRLIKLLIPYLELRYKGSYVTEHGEFSLKNLTIL